MPPGHRLQFHGLGQQRFPVGFLFPQLQEGGPTGQHRLRPGGQTATIFSQERPVAA